MRVREGVNRRDITHLRSEAKEVRRHGWRMDALGRELAEPSRTKPGVHTEPSLADSL